MRPFFIYVPDSGAAQDQVDDGDVDGGDGGSVGVLDDHQQRHRLLFGKQVRGPQGKPVVIFVCSKNAKNCHVAITMA